MQHHLSKESKATRSEYLAQQMANLKVGREDLHEMSELKIDVDERLI